MWGKIGLEEHFAIPETLDDSRGFFPDHIWGELKARLLDLHDNRLRLMDEYGTMPRSGSTAPISARTTASRSAAPMRSSCSSWD
jgi:hypothetical protein